jgi:hypothetical protein
MNSYNGERGRTTIWKSIDKKRSLPPLDREAFRESGERKTLKMLKSKLKIKNAEPIKLRFLLRKVHRKHDEKVLCGIL